MKALFLTTSYPRYLEDDTSVFIRYLAESLTSTNVRVEIIVPCDGSPLTTGDSAGRLQIRRFRYGIFRSGTLVFGAGLLPTLRRYPSRALQLPMLCWKMFKTGYEASKRADVIHAHWIIPAGVGVLIARLRNIPLIVTVHGSEMLLLRSKFLSFLLKCILSQADSIVTVSEGFKCILTERYPELSGKITWVPYGSDHFSAKNETALNDELENIFSTGKAILSVGTLGPRKNQKELVRLLTLAEFKDASVVLCGKTDDSSYVEKIRDLARKLGVENRVYIIGAQPPHVVASLLKRCALFVSASKFEGRPVALLEALAAGCITLVSRIPAHEEIIKDGFNGYLFDLKSDISSEIPASIMERDCKKKIQANAIASINGFSWESCASNYLNLYSSIRYSHQKAA